MLARAVLVLCGLVCVCWGAYVDFTDSALLCAGSQSLNASYVGTGFDHQHYINLVDAPLRDRAKCIRGGAVVKLQMKSVEDAQEFLERVENMQVRHGEDVFLHGLECDVHCVEGRCLSLPAVVRVVKAKRGPSSAVVLLGRPAGLADSFVDLDLQVISSGNQEHAAFCAGGEDDTHSKHFCLGVNVDQDGGKCDKAKSVLPLYNWAGPGGISVDVTCPNCYAGLSGNVFVKVDIEATRLSKTEAGFTDLTLDAAFVADITATENFNVGVDRQLPIVPPTTIFSFQILVVPVNFWFQIPVHALANLGVFAQGEVTAGFEAQVVWPKGLFFQWTKSKPWHMEQDSATKTVTPVFSGTAEADANAILLMQPSIQFYLDKVFHTTLDLIPEMTANATWSLDTRQLCAGVDYDVKLQATANFDADVSWLGIHDHKQWGPYVFWDTGEVALAQTCLPTSE